MSTPERSLPPSRTDMSNWPSYAYWRESDDHVKRFWYVSFCLMMSSVQDRLTGLALQESGNLNWATTAFYYSGVHAGRLVCFVCFGDYYKGHGELAALLAPTQVPRPQNPRRRFRFTWLDEFLRYVTPNEGSRATRDAQDRASAENTSPDRAALVAMIDAILPNVRPAFERFAPLLAKFRNLRNDCNYEALLVAHEVNHDIGTQGFRDLVVAADQASDLAVRLAIIAYLEHTKSAQCFDFARGQFHAAHARYLSGRFERSLGQKFVGSSAAMDELRRTRDRLDWPGAPAGIDVKAFLAPIMYDEFGEKKGLMARWRADIRALQGATE